MKCKVCNKNETGNTLGMCWECYSSPPTARDSNSIVKEVEKKAEYPKLPRELNANVKLTVAGIIRILYHDIGISQRGMGRLFGVDKATIGAYLKSPLENREKRYKYNLVREDPKRKKERREIMLDKYLEWERKKGLYKRESERIKKNKTRKKPYHPILLLRNLLNR